MFGGLGGRSPYKGLGGEGAPVQRFGRGGRLPYKGLEGREGDSRTEVWREMRAGFCVRELFDQVLARSARA